MTREGSNGLNDFFRKEWKAVSYAFLGVGLTLFGLNLSAMLSYLPQQYSKAGFNISVFTSILLIVYIVYTLYEKKSD